MNIEPIMDDEQKEQARQLNLIGELDRLHRVNWELQQKGLMFDIEITRLRAENETLRRDVKTAVMGDSAELQDVKRENEKLREALEPFAEKYQDNGLTHSMYIFEMKHLLAAKKLLGETDE